MVRWEIVEKIREHSGHQLLVDLSYLFLDPRIRY